MRRVAIIPARGGSKRLPRKNILDLCGKPMLGYAVKVACDCDLFDHVIVSTEDEEIAQIAKKMGASVMARDDALATDQSTVSQVCLDVLAKLEREKELPEFFCAIYPTAAFLIKEDIIESEKKLHSPHAPDVVMGVSAYPIHPYKAMEERGGALRPVFPRENDQKSQTYPHWVASNGTFYWARSETFREHPDFYPKNLVGHELPQDRSIDIDTPDDFLWAQALMELKTRKKQC